MLVDIDGDYTETLAASLEQERIGVFGLAFYENNADKLKVATRQRIVPSTRHDRFRRVSVSRPLFF